MGSKGKNRKQIPKRAKSSRSVGKNPRTSPGFPTDQTRKLSWHVQRLDMDGPFGWNNLDKPTLLTSILPKLKGFESQTWPETLGRNSHEVSVASLCRDAQRRLDSIGQSDIEQLVSLRLTGKQRIWGIRQDGVFCLLWWDPEHLVCPSQKRHT